MKDEDASVRDLAASALGRIGSDARDALPALILALKDEEASVRYSSNLALAKIGIPAVPSLIEAFSNDVALRQEVIFTLGLLGPDAQDAISILTRAVEDDDPVVQRRAAFALGKVTSRTG